MKETASANPTKSSHDTECQDKGANKLPYGSDNVKDEPFNQVEVERPCAEIEEEIKRPNDPVIESRRSTRTRKSCVKLDPSPEFNFTRMTKPAKPAKAKPSARPPLPEGKVPPWKKLSALVISRNEYNKKEKAKRKAPSNEHIKSKFHVKD